MKNLSKLIFGFIFLLSFYQSNIVFGQETRMTRYTYSQENSFWLDMIDRATVLTFKPGIIRDYDTRMDEEYWIDHSSYDYSILDDSRFVESKNGFRGWSGSINSSRFFTEGSFKVAHQFEDHVYFNLNYTREENYQSDHNVMLLTIGRNGLGNQKINLYCDVSLETDKEDLDLDLGVSWEPIEKLKLDLQLVSLDFLNNLMSESISEHQQLEKRVFDKQPYAFRFRSSYEWNDFRFELFGASNTPEKTKLTFENKELADFTEEINYYYWGGKAEKQWWENLTTGLFWNVRSAEHIRVGRDENNYQVKEEHAQYGVYGMYKLNERWRFESEVSYTKINVFKKGVTSSIDLDTNNWGLEAKVTAFMRVQTKWQAQAGLLIDRHVMNTLLPKYPLDNKNIRLALGFRYQAKDNFYVMLTSNIGLENFFNYDGSSIQLQYLW